MMIVSVGRAVIPPGNGLAGLAIAIITAVGWELVEHADWVLNKSRAASFCLGYIGDSALNAVSG